MSDEKDNLIEQLEKATTHLDELLNLERQVWLFGAGISKDAGIPLMYPLTARVESLLSSDKEELGSIDTVKSAYIFGKVKSQLPDDSHVEHLLSQIGDLVSLAERKQEALVDFSGDKITAEELRKAHRHIQLAIRYTVENGYLPASGEGKNKITEEIGSPDKVIVDRTHHDEFVENLFHRRRAGLEEHNPAVCFVTTNYDTLLEDALAHAHVGYVDGFAGGATGFWDPRNSDQRLQDIRKVSRHSAI